MFIPTVLLSKSLHYLPIACPLTENAVPLIQIRVIPVGQVSTYFLFRVHSCMSWAGAIRHLLSKPYYFLGNYYFHLPGFWKKHSSSACWEPQRRVNRAQDICHAARGWPLMQHNLAAMSPRSTFRLVLGLQLIFSVQLHGETLLEMVTAPADGGGAAPSSAASAPQTSSWCWCDAGTCTDTLVPALTHCSLLTFLFLKEIFMQLGNRFLLVACFI